MKAQGIVLWDLVEKYFREREFLDRNSETIFQDGKQIPKDNVAADKTTPKLKKKTNKQIKTKKQKRGFTKLVW